METLTSKEKKSINRMLYEMMTTDGSTDPKEAECWKSIRNELNISEQENEESASMDYMTVLVTIATLPAKKKILCMQMLLKMMSADNKINFEEEYFFNDMCRIMDVDKEARKDANVTIQLAKLIQ